MERFEAYEAGPIELSEDETQCANFVDVTPAQAEIIRSLCGSRNRYFKSVQIEYDDASMILSVSLVGSENAREHPMEIFDRLVTDVKMYINGTSIAA